jgi:hypothetical protein
VITKEILCDKCLAMFDRCIAEGRPNDIELCKKCKAKLDRMVAEAFDKDEEENS